MHQGMHWALGIMAALGISLPAGSVLAGPPPVSPSMAPPVVIRANVDLLEPDRLVIRGMNFGVRSAPIVLLAKVPLAVLSFSDEQIVARLPIDAPPARYRLQVLAHGTSPSAFFEVTLGRRSEG
jgi:IPT/TIG domain